LDHSHAIYQLVKLFVQHDLSGGTVILVKLVMKLGEISTKMAKLYSFS